MRRTINSVLVFAAAVVLLAPATAERVFSRQKGAAVATEGRISPDSARSSGRKSRAAAASNDEPTPSTRGRLIREIESLEQQCLDDVNRVRRAQRLSPLGFYADLLPVARAYSRRMAEEHFFSHDDPEGRTVRERVSGANIRWRIVGENLSYSNGYINPVAASIHGWMESPGHRRNLLDPEYNVTAIGAWIGTDGTVYFTEIFLKQ
jgi:uncharacterized protein YkwD